MTKVCSLLGIWIVLGGCGAPATPSGTVQGDQQAVKMRHQIVFRGADADQVEVFEGYMILQRDAFVVKAFAGPGVDLFTVVRNGEDHFEELHIPGLADKIDVKKVGSDIARVYLGGCVLGRDPGKRDCDFFGERLTETYDGLGHLVERFFPQAHGIGLTVRYEGYKALPGWGEPLPKRIALTWGHSPNRMEIVLVSCEPLTHLEPELFTVPSAPSSKP